MNEKIPHNYARYFGGCPVCGCDAECHNIGREQWFDCPQHKRKWCAGSNLFDSWKYETQSEWFENWEYLSDFEKVEGVLDVRQTTDWISGNRGTLLTRVAKEERSAVLQSLKATVDNVLSANPTIDRLQLFLGLLDQLFGKLNTDEERRRFDLRVLRRSAEFVDSQPLDSGPWDSVPF